MSLPTSRAQGDIVDPVDINQIAEAVNANTVLFGTGSPEGVVAAQLGTRYIDTSATAGAVEWAKLSGSKAIGWVLTYGNTGWRRIDTLTGVAAGTVVLSRVNDIVYMMLSDVTVVAAGHVNVAPTPPGFAPQSFTGANWRNGIVMDVSATSPRVASWLGNNMRILNAETGKAYGGCLTWVTDDPWPTTLPGTAA